MFLAVNIGNTHIVVGVFDGDDLWQEWRVSSNPSRTVDETRMTFRQLFLEKELLIREFRGCLISSVIPRLADTAGAALEELLGIVPLVLTHDLDLGVSNRYQHPEDVGTDRLANAVGGVERYGAPLIILDSGTATTFDVISSDRAYLGGIIMPGLEMSADALFQKTSLLPRIALSPPKEVIGRSTRDSIVSGLVWGTVAAVDDLVRRIRKEIGEADCPVVATGGNARLIVDLSSELERVDPDLTLYGLLKIWERNSSR